MENSDKISLRDNEFEPNLKKIERITKEGLSAIPDHPLGGLIAKFVRQYYSGLINKVPNDLYQTLSIFFANLPKMEEKKIW